LGAAEGSHFVGPGGEEFVAAQSIVGSMTFPNYLRAMRRPDLRRDPRFATAQQRLENYDALHSIIQTWMFSFRDLASLDAQLDEAKIAIGQIRTLKELASTEWAQQWGAVQEISDRRGGTYKLHGYPWHFSADTLGQRAAPAYRGEHNVEVFREAGLSDKEIQHAISSGMLLSAVPATAATTLGDSVESNRSDASKD